MDGHAEPERALRAVERLHGLVLSVHDLHGDLAPFIDPERLHHRHPLCTAVRHGGGEPDCIAFDIDRCREAAERHPDGLVKLCPAGLVELTMPIRHRGTLAAMLFAGVLAPDGLDDGIDLRARRAATRSGLRRVAPDELDALLETLRQLRARLLLWLDGTVRTASPVETQAMARRDVVIRQFIHQFHDGPLAIGDLARHLGLSVSRTRAVVQASCGGTFTSLLTATRLAVADDLLVHTDLNVHEVALRCGFGTAPHFFRRFHAAHGCSPRAYRQAARTGVTSGGRAAPPPGGRDGAAGGRPRP